jgi:hypothetical protein
MIVAGAARDTRAWPDDKGLKFSGHESFVIRYRRLPKLHGAVVEAPELFSSDEHAIFALGLGRKMVKSIRFWSDALGLIRQEGRWVVPTELALRLLDPTTGRDPYLEDVSLWRLHWLLVTGARLGAWATLFMDICNAVIPCERLVATVAGRAESLGSRVSPSTAHVDILVRTYHAGRSDGPAIVEDALGCPLQELHPVRQEAVLGTPTTRLSRGPKPTLDLPALAFALHDFWQHVHLERAREPVRTGEAGSDAGDQGRARAPAPCPGKPWRSADPDADVRRRRGGRAGERCMPNLHAVPEESQGVRPIGI